MLKIEDLCLELVARLEALRVFPSGEVFPCDQADAGSVLLLSRGCNLWK